MKEKTAGAAGIIGFSHYKTCAKYDDLNSVDTFLCNAPFLIEVLPDHLMTITDLQILKQIGIFNVAKMRYIQFMDPEFNVKNKLLGKRMMENAEAANVIQNDQFGGRKKHKAINACLNKVLTNDIFRQKNMLRLLEWRTQSDVLTDCAILLRFLFSSASTYAQNY